MRMSARKDKATLGHILSEGSRRVSLQPAVTLQLRFVSGDISDRSLGYAHGQAECQLGANVSVLAQDACRSKHMFYHDKHRSGV